MMDNFEKPDRQFVLGTVMEQDRDKDTDVLKSSRVKVYAPVYEQIIKPSGSTTSDYSLLPWVVPMYLSQSGDEVQDHLIPAKGTVIMIYFANNDISKPYYLPNSIAAADKLPNILTMFDAVLHSPDIAAALAQIKALYGDDIGDALAAYVSENEHKKRLSVRKDTENYIFNSLYWKKGSELIPASVGKIRSFNLSTFTGDAARAVLRMFGFKGIYEFFRTAYFKVILAPMIYIVNSHLEYRLTTADSTFTVNITGNGELLLKCTTVVGGIEKIKHVIGVTPDGVSMETRKPDQSTDAKVTVAGHDIQVVALDGTITVDGKSVTVQSAQTLTLGGVDGVNLISAGPINLTCTAGYLNGHEILTA